MSLGQNMIPIKEQHWEIPKTLENYPNRRSDRVDRRGRTQHAGQVPFRQRSPTPVPCRHHHASGGLAVSRRIAP